MLTPRVYLLWRSREKENSPGSISVFFSVRSGRGKEAVEESVSKSAEEAGAESGAGAVGEGEGVTVNRDELRRALIKMAAEDSDISFYDDGEEFRSDSDSEDVLVLDLGPASKSILRTGEAAEYLGVSVWTLRDHVHHGRLPRLAGGAWRFERGDLNKFLKRTKETEDEL
jgi:excisionase family DNA binding protein